MNLIIYSLLLTFKEIIDDTPSFSETFRTKWALKLLKLISIASIYDGDDLYSCKVCWGCELKLHRRTVFRELDVSEQIEKKRMNKVCGNQRGAEDTRRLATHQISSAGLIQAHKDYVPSTGPA